MKKIMINYKPELEIQQMITHLSDNYRYVSASYHALNSMPPNSDLVIPSRVMPLLAKESTIKNMAIIAEDARTWLKKMYLIDSINIVNHYVDKLLEFIVKYEYFESLSPLGRIDDERINNSIIEKTKLGFEAKLDYIASIVIGQKQKFEFKSNILAVNKLRNAFIHNNGIIAKHHTNNETKDALLIHGLDKVLPDGSNLNTATIDFSTCCFVFKINEPITLSWEFIHNLFYEFYGFGQEIADIVPASLQAKNPKMVSITGTRMIK